MLEVIKMSNLTMTEAIENLQNDDVSIRKEAIESLIGVTDEAAIDPLIEATTDENAQDVINRHRQIVQLINNLAGQSTSKYTVCDVYMKIYQSYQKAQDKFLQLQEIQDVVITYLRNNKTIYPNLENQLKNASSMEEEIAVFLSYYKEH